MGKLVACAKCRKVFSEDVMRIPFTTRWRKTCAFCGAERHLVEPSASDLEKHGTAEGRAVWVWVTLEFAASLAIGAWWIYAR